MSVYQIQVNIYMFGTENWNILNGFPTFSVHKKNILLNFIQHCYYRLLYFEERKCDFDKQQIV